MKRIGLIGGMSWESTRLYYAAINEDLRARRGGLSSADMVIVSLDFGRIAALQAAGEWEAAGAALAQAARDVQAAGAGIVGLATNTMHKMADEIIAATPLPFVHIADAAAAALVDAGKRRPYLMATRFTMEQAFYRGQLEAFGLDVVVPDEAARAMIHRVIFDELCVGRIEPASRAAYEAETVTARNLGCDSILLGCTEVGLLLSDANSALPTFDTARIHARALLDAALST